MAVCGEAPEKLELCFLQVSAEPLKWAPPPKKRGGAKMRQKIKKFLKNFKFSLILGPPPPFLGGGAHFRGGSAETCRKHSYDFPELLHIPPIFKINKKCKKFFFKIFEFCLILAPPSF